MVTNERVDVDLLCFELFGQFERAEIFEESPMHEPVQPRTAQRQCAIALFKASERFTRGATGPRWAEAPLVLEEIFDDAA